MAYPSSDRFFPPKGAPEAELLAYRDRVINRWSVYRNQHMARIALSLWYYLGKQWATLDPDMAFDGIRGAIIRDMDGNSSQPRPVTNMISPAIEAEIISLVKRQWIPKVTPTSNDPRIKAAAQVANDSLQYRLEQLSWPEKRHQLALNFAFGGTGLIYTAWDRVYSDLHAIGAPTAVFCRSCNDRAGTGGMTGKFYSSEIDSDVLRGVMGAAGGMPMPFVESVAKPLVPSEADLDGTLEDRVELRGCPMCGGGLEPYDPTESEVGDVKAVDVFGRPLSVLEPRGSVTLEIDLPFEFYPQDAGVRVTPDTMRRWGRRKIRSLEWLEERAPHLVHEIAPDSISDLLYDDPLLGQWSVLGSWSSSLDAGILDNHVNVDEVVEMPTFRNPEGRYLLCTKDKVIEDADLLETAKDRNEDEDEDEDEEIRTGSGGGELYVPRCMVSASRYKIRPNEFWGTNLPEEVISPQNRLNGMDSQIIETRLRLGSPNMSMPLGMWPAEGAVTDEGWGSGKLLFYQPDPSQPDAKPEVIGGQLMPPEIYMERDRVQTDMKHIVGPGDVAGGMAPKNIGTTSGLELLVQQDEQGRALREDSLVGSAEKSWSHLGQLQWVLRVDDDVYRVMGPNQTWKYQQYRGMSLRGQTEVKIERGAFIAKSVLTREAHREALADKLIDISSPVARRKMREAYGVSGDVNEDTDNQVDQAERQWVEFVDQQHVRVQDTLDDPAIRYAVFQTMLLSEEGQRLTEEARWDETVRQIAGWQEELQNLVNKEAEIISFYGGSRLIGQEAAEAFAQATIAYQQQQQLYAEGQQIAAQQQQLLTMQPQMPGAPPPAATPMMPPPTPPPPPLDIPVLLQDRILFVWDAMIKAREAADEFASRMQQGTVGLGAPPPPAPAPPSIDEDLQAPQKDPRIYMKMRALVEAYRLSAGGGVQPLQDQGQQMQTGTGTPAGAPAGEPTSPAAAPSTASTPDGGQH